MQMSSDVNCAFIPCCSVVTIQAILTTVPLSDAFTIHYRDRLDTGNTVRLAKPMGPSRCYWRVLGNWKNFKIAT